MKPAYNHAFTIAFSLENESPTGEDTTAKEMHIALLKRLVDLMENDEIEEAVGMPYDTYEVQK